MSRTRSSQLFCPLSEVCGIFRRFEERGRARLRVRCHFSARSRIVVTISLGSGIVRLENMVRTSQLKETVSIDRILYL